MQGPLPRTTSEPQDARVNGDRLIEQARELAALGPCAQPCQVVARRVSGERRVLVEAAHQVNSCVIRKPQVRDTGRRFVLRTATVTRPIRVERTLTRRTGE